MAASKSKILHEDLEIGSFCGRHFRSQVAADNRETQHLFVFVIITIRKSQLRSFRRAIALESPQFEKKFDLPS
jgi:hypothetical protein